MKRSTNTTKKNTLKRSSNVTDGENLSANAAGFDDQGGVAPGVGVAGGISHFSNISKSTIQH